MFGLKTSFQSIKNRKFLEKDLTTIHKVNCSDRTLQTIPLHIITVTYNNENLLEHQIALTHKNMEDKHILIVADNSSDPARRKAIEAICSKNNITYLSLPKNPYSTGSLSHSMALNWLFRNYVSVIKPDFFGFIDHDVFPVKSHSLVKLLNLQNVFGHLQSRGDYWYLWPGLCFFSFELTKNMNLDFSPCSVNGTNLDTGGANWNVLYSRLDKKRINFPEHSYSALRDGEVFQSDKLEVIGDWLHSFNGSYWMNVKPKEDELGAYLKKYY